MLREDHLKENPFENKKNLINDFNTIPSIEESELNDEYYISERFEISKLANKIFNKFAYFSITFVLMGYLYISLTSNGIIVGNSLLKVIPKSFDIELDDVWYNYFVLGFFFIVLLVSLNNINKLKSFGIFIIGMRVIIILLIFSLNFHTMGKYGIADIKEIPLFNFSNITIMIGNSLFFFMSHHSIPGMVEKFYPQKHLIKYMTVAYFCSFIFMVLYGGVSIFAFAKVRDCDCSKFPCAIQVNIFP